MKIDKKLIEELVDHLDEFDLTELEYSDGTKKIKVSKGSKANLEQRSNTVVSNNKTVLSSDEEGTAIKSPIIGTAYLSPEPGSKKFIDIGDKIKKGQTIMIVEAMKTMNHVPSTVDGTIKEICVEDGQPVEYGQTIIIVE